MNIGIDARLLEGRITGVGRFLHNLVSEIPNFDDVNKYFLFSYSKLDDFDGFYKTIATGSNRLNDKLYSPYWLNFVLPNYLYKYKIDLFFAPNNITIVRKLKGIKRITTVHDLFYLLNKGFHPLLYRIYLNLFFPLSIKKSDSIITISEHSKRDIIKYFDVNLEKLFVLYQYAKQSFRKLELDEDAICEVRKKNNLPEKYILYVGVIEKRKNIDTIIEVSEYLTKRQSQLKVVLIGRLGYGSNDILKKIANKKDKVIYLPNVDDFDLLRIYNSAFAFIFPSFYEGFGLPPLEAMQCGLPVIVSNTSSLPEVVGCGGSLFEPKDSLGFTDELLKLESDEKYYKKMKHNAILQSAKFSKERTMNNLISIFNK